LNRKQWSLVRKFINNSLSFDDPFYISQNYFISHFGLEKYFYNDLCKIAKKEKAFLVERKNICDEHIPSSGDFIEFRKYPG